MSAVTDFVNIMNIIVDFVALPVYFLIACYVIRNVGKISKQSNERPKYVFNHKKTELSWKQKFIGEWNVVKRNGFDKVCIYIN